jgi:hypothetical protein
VKNNEGYIGQRASAIAESLVQGQEGNANEPEAEQNRCDPLNQRNWRSVDGKLLFSSRQGHLPTRNIRLCAPPNITRNQRRISYKTKPERRSADFNHQQ